MTIYIYIYILAYIGNQCFNLFVLKHWALARCLFFLCERIKSGLLLTQIIHHFLRHLGSKVAALVTCGGGRCGMVFSIVFIMFSCGTLDTMCQLHDT